MATTNRPPDVQQPRLDFGDGMLTKCPDCGRKTAARGPREDWPGGYNEPWTCPCGSAGEWSRRTR